MRFVVANVRTPHATRDHREFDEFRDRLVSQLGSDEFDPFWENLSTTGVERPVARTLPPLPPRPAWIDLLALLHVT